MPLKISTTDHPYETHVDLSRDEFWRQSYEERDVTFSWLRKNRPVSWHRPMDSRGFPHEEKGWWAITRAEDIRYASEHNELFSSEGPSIAFRPEADRGRRSMLDSDSPEHEKYRMMVSSAFTPKAVKRLAEKIEQRAAEIVDRVRGAGNVDFVAEVSSKLPMMTVADIIGLPEEVIPEFTEAGNRFAGAEDPEIRPAGVAVPEFVMQQFETLGRIGVEFVDYRRKHPAEDLATALGRDFNGRSLTNEEIAGVTLLLSVAGNDTTKQTTGLSVYQLWGRHQEQRKMLADDFDNRIPGAIEEFIRHGSPVQMFGRTALTDTTLGGAAIAKGDRIVMLYGSGNRDEAEFEDPWRFDITRPRSRHVGFGGGGIHYCLGSAVAKTQLRALFRQFVTKLYDMEVGEPEYLASDVFYGFRKFPVRIP